MSAEVAEVAHILAHRHKGGALVTITRGGRRRQHRISLRRYRALYEWTLARTPWPRSGSWLRNGLDVTLWSA